MKTPKSEESQMKAIQRMSTLPIGTELIFLDETWPIIKKENCYIMPGLPSVCHRTIEKLTRILPEKCKHYQASWYLKAKEHEYFEWLDEIAQAYGESVAIGSYPLDKDSPLQKEGVRSQIALNSNDYGEGKKCYQDILEYLNRMQFLITHIEYHPV